MKKASILTTQKFKQKSKHKHFGLLLNSIKHFNRILPFILFLTSFTVQTKAQIPLPTYHLKSKEVFKSKPQLEFAPEGGFYSMQQEVELFCQGCHIYFTTDGSMPYISPRLLYKKPIKIKDNTVIRAFAILNNIKSETVSHTFFINEPKSTIPVVSLSVTSDLLFDPEKGLFVEGELLDSTSWQKKGANFWSKKELIVNTEFFTPDSICQFRGATGMRIFGGLSRLFPQKSLTLVARSRYGKKRIKYPIFGKDEQTAFKFLVLRNSGSDFGKTHFRDAFMTSLVKDWNIDTQANQPAHVYLNGEYWGIYNIREKINRYFLANHYDLDKDSIDLMEHKLTRKRGSSKHYIKFLKFLIDHDLSIPSHYNYVKRQIDIESFMDLQIAQIYFDNHDAGGNIKYWRPNTSNGKWKWILYDTDWGFGLQEEKAYTFNTLKFHTNNKGNQWPNPAWSTFILRKLLKNSTFKRLFVNRFLDRLNTDLQQDNVIAFLDQVRASYEPEIDRHIKRWRLSSKNREWHIDRMYNFAQKRPQFIKKHVKDFFGLGQQVKVRIAANKGGIVTVNKLINVHYQKPLQGSYFQDYPIFLEAKPNLGYRFVGWKETTKENDKLLIIDFNNLPHREITRTAIFEKFDHPLAGKIIFNEINSNNKLAGDWVEIYNNSDKTIDMSGWLFTDRNNKYTLPNVQLPAKDYLILCQNKQKFAKTHPSSYRFFGNLTFGLNKIREDLALFDKTGAWIDSVSYHLPPKDSLFTLSLLLPSLDNSDIENWTINKGTGSPNEANPYYVSSNIKAKRDRWLQIGGALGIVLLCIFLLFAKKKMNLDDIL